MRLCRLVWPLLVFSSALAAAPRSVEVVNHFPFAVRQPVGEVVADLPAGGRVSIALPQAPRARMLEASAESDALRFRSNGVDLGAIAWGLIVKLAGPVDHVAEFQPLDLKFKAAARASNYTVWQADEKHTGFGITVAARVWDEGFVDWDVALRNVSADCVSGMYGALIARWQHPGAKRHLLSYDNRPEDFGPGGATRFSAGEGRHQALQHGLDWIALDFGAVSALVLNGFPELGTALDDAESARNKSPRFVGVSLPQFKNEARMAGGSLYLISEFARPNHPYRDRFLENRLPEVGRAIHYWQRMDFLPALPARSEADERFTAYNTWTGEEQGRVEIGVPGVTFGASYFPYSTLGENFGALKLPGQETDAYWPLSADTVTHWREFAEDIRRDLRIATAMGFSVIRLHYLDVIARLPESVQFEYLDFLFGELRRLKLRAMFSTAFTYWTPEQIAARVARYADTIDRVEIENEVLIWGIPLNRPQYWSRVYDAVKKAAPHVAIHWTGHLNTGIFDRMDDLHLRYDAVSAHSYIDALDAIPSGRGFALAIAAQAARKRKPAIYTEWNWRGLTRMTPEARAAVYPPIMENLLATRGIRELYPFQFQQTMCVNPHTRRGIRQYEPLWLSRRPKPEAFELMKLIAKYSMPSAPARLLWAEHEVAEFAGGRATVRYHLRNDGAQPLRLGVSVEGPPELDARADPAVVRIAPGSSAEVVAQVLAKSELPPGFYHLFLRLELPGGELRYAWAELRRPGQPEGAAFDVNRPVAVVYGEDAPDIEMEAAYLTAATLESASGRPVGLYSARNLPAGARGALILIGTPKTNALAVRPPAGALLLDGYDAAVKFTLSYWMKAKDSAARRVGLVEKTLAAGADVANLP